MKTVLLGPAYPYRGGIAAFNERLARQLIQDGHEVEIFTFTLQYPSLLFPGKTQYSDSEPPAGLAITRRVNSLNPFNWIRVGRMIRRMAPDRLIVKFWTPFLAPCLGTIARIAKKGGKVRVVSIPDNIVPHEKKFTDTALARYFVNSIDAFVAMSDSVMKDLRALDRHGKPKVLRPHPIYDHFGPAMSKKEAAAHLGIDPKGRYVLFFGFIRDYKGLDRLIEAMADQRLKKLGIKLIVAGEFYEDESKYKVPARQLGVEENIVWHTHFISDDQVRYYFNAADIVAQPYKTATQSGVTQIAYHFEKPMLVTDVGGLAEIVPDGKAGYVVKPEVKAISDALYEFFGGESLPDFSAGIKEQKQKFSWAEMAETAINI
ncbi:MAG: glycosyltransferase [Bacteroidales bacterium]|nr:glycosyltransferase [Bacteroidales bacterium]